MTTANLFTEWESITWYPAWNFFVVYVNSYIELNSISVEFLDDDKYTAMVARSG